MSEVAIHWFRQDLRLADNPAFCRAVQSGRVLPIFILDDDAAGEDRIGGASRWWLQRSLEALNTQLGGHLRLYRGRALDILLSLVEIYGAKLVSWTRCYEPWRIERDKKIVQDLERRGIASVRMNGSLLWEPWMVAKKDGTPYRVFTPFFRKGCLSADAPSMPIEAPSNIRYAKQINGDGAVDLGTFGLLHPSGWHNALESCWDMSEAGALCALERFLNGGLAGYKQQRDFPAKPHVSRLSPYLHWGQISPNQVWYSLYRLEGDGIDPKDLDHFRSELAWREFSYHLLFHNREIPRRALNVKFEAFDWRTDPAMLSAWQRGETGIPIVDAGMRELWQTGFMHNRVRMVVASFLIKNLRIDWRLGMAWFWDCLVDADLASNSASWQWVAGCGADAAPFYRVFNPVLQAEKFDPDGEYIRCYVPELKGLPSKYVGKPWLVPQAVLDDAGIVLGGNYPLPIVDLKRSRVEALEAYKALNEVGLS